MERHTDTRLHDTHHSPQRMEGHRSAPVVIEELIPWGNVLGRKDGHAVVPIHLSTRKKKHT